MTSNNFFQAVLHPSMAWDSWLHPTNILSFSFCLSVCLFRAVPEVYGGSQARSLIRAVAASLRQSHSNDGSKLHLRPTPHSSRQRWILNPWSEARDETRNLRVPSQIRFHCATMGTPTIILDKDYRRNKSVNIITISNAIIWQFWRFLANTTIYVSNWYEY